MTLQRLSPTEKVVVKIVAVRRSHPAVKAVKETKTILHIIFAANQPILRFVANQKSECFKEVYLGFNYF